MATATPTSAIESNAASGPTAAAGWIVASPSAAFGRRRRHRWSVAGSPTAESP